ncbi:hypothetical protein BCR36DRAFT_325940 [Piromyces finnis]|uniref:Inner centromere protein ARK-binding domain-containing protein n=1 Tax=Piromyces finnis TaxID=1754191 RepID=A0A1Y1VAY4_9FUNG|nr:hypothetical protein BCR36DRAFT_325940 [Piromyces finnis]|eukprot:ORX51523.1 hypothetical protein BCR36DRAFT_325940 [Piromyces finnis]
MTDSETVKIPYFLSKKIGLFQNIKNGYMIDFNKSVDNQLDWLNTQKSTIDNLLNSTKFNIIQKQITENVEPTDISNNLQSLSLSEININKELTKNENNNTNNNNSIIDLFDDPPPSLLDFTKNFAKEEKPLVQNKDRLSDKRKSKLSSISINSVASLNEKSKEQLFNKLLLKDTLSIENLNPLIEEIIKNNSKEKNSNVTDKKENTILKKESQSLGSSKSEFINSDIKKKEKPSNHHSFPNDHKNKIDNRHSIINKDVYKTVNDKSEHSKKLSSSSDVLTDFKRSLNSYTARKKKSTLLSLNDTIDSSTTVKNNVESTKSMSPLLNLEDDTLTSNINNNSISNMDTMSGSKKVINIKEESTEMKGLARDEKRLSTLIDEVENLYKSHSKLREFNESFSSINNDEFKECEEKVEDNSTHRFTPLNSKNDHSNKKFGEFKTCDEIIEDIYRKAKTTEKRVKSGKRSVTATAFNILTSPFTPFSYGSHSDKKSKTISSTPDKSVNESGGSKKSVSERFKGFKAIWDSTTKSLHSAFSRNLSSDNEEKKYNTHEVKTIAPSVHLYNSPERDTNLTSSINASKSTNFKNEKMKDTNPLTKVSSCSVPSKNKVNIFSSTTDDYKIEFKDTNGMSFATAIQSPSDSPLAYISAKKLENNDKNGMNTIDNNKTKNLNVLDDNIFKSIIDDDSIKSPYLPSSPLYHKVNKTLQKSNPNNNNNNFLDSLKQSPSRHAYLNKGDAMIIDNKDTSDLTEQPSNTSENQKTSSWNGHFNSSSSSKETHSLIPKNSKLKRSNLKKSKLKSLESAKLIKKHEDVLTLDKKQKIKMSIADKHRLYMQRKKKEEGERKAGRKEEEKRTKSEKPINQQKQVEELIRKRNEKIKQMNEKKRAMKMKETKSNLYGTTSSVIASTLDKFKNNTKLDTTIILKQKNNNSHTIKKSNAPGNKKYSVSSILSSSSATANTTTALKKSSIPKVKSTIGKSSKSNLSSINNSTRYSSSSTAANLYMPSSSHTTTTAAANLSTQNILAGLDMSSSNSILLGLNANQDNSMMMNDNKNNSIISISSSRSSATPYRGTILQDGEFPDIPSDYEDDENSRLSLVATWARPSNLLKALEKQKDVNPDIIFGGYKPCRIDEIFRGLSSYKPPPPPDNLADSSILHEDE